MNGISSRDISEEVPLIEDGVERPLVPQDNSTEIWAPWSLVVATKNPNVPPPVSVKEVGPAWDVGQVLNAARLLLKPPIHVDFSDEHEMRCVYSLIYDVFRYKSILDQAIEDIDFFKDFPEHANHRHTVWLFLMDLARRKWGSRPREEVERATKLLKEAGPPFQDIEKTIWEQRVHFAAAVARIRIKKKAYSISELLPAHLREERVSACVNKETFTGWVNTFKEKKVALLVKRLHDLGYSYSGSKQLCAGEYRFDRVCPRFITMRPPENESIGQLDIVKKGIIVLQEREFCEGASTLCRALRARALHGAVAQTHASSPRSSAYLAAQLRELALVLKASKPSAPTTPDLGKLLVFGAGNNANSYVSALRDLGIEASEVPQSNAAVCVISDAVYCDTPTVISALDGVVAVLATPPNSYSAVTDPIDLVCGRGGDLAMLEILTECDMDAEGKARVQSILEEQKKTLKALLSKPQIQLVLYETHSSLAAENQAQVTRAVAEANRLARERHLLLRKKHQLSGKLKDSGLDIANTDSISSLGQTISISEIQVNDPSSNAPLKWIESTTYVNRSRPPSGSVVRKHAEEGVNVISDATRPQSAKARPIPSLPSGELMPLSRNLPNDGGVHVPSCDLFEIGNLPNLGNGLDLNYILDRDGCYLGLIQRKEIIRMDAKYMIRMAEERGLFGATVTQPLPKKKKPDVPQRRRRRKTAGFQAQMERVCAPTHSSLNRARYGSAPTSREQYAGAGSGGAKAERGGEAQAEGCGVCLRHERRQAAASALFDAQCSCDAKHRHTRLARAAATKNVPLQCLPSPPCRRPFPLTVHDLHLKTIKQPKIFFA